MVDDRDLVSRRYPDVLASDDEREAVALRLRDAAGEGRLMLEELTSRLQLAYSARTRDELQRLTADLPQTPALRAQPAPARAGRAGGSRWVVAVMSGARRRGRWRPGRRCTAVSVMGGCELDLRQAEISGGQLDILALTVMGGVQVVVPEGLEVNVSGVAIMGGKDVRLGDVPPQPGTPVINVHVLALMGGVSVRSKRSQRLSR